MNYNRCYFDIIVNDLDKALRFYTNETNWFYKEQDLGMGYFKLLSKLNPSFGIVLIEDDEYIANDNVILTFSTNELDSQYLKLLNINFNSGAKIFNKDGIFEYPGGRNFLLLDPCGNNILIEELISP